MEIYHYAQPTDAMVLDSIVKNKIANGEEIYNLSAGDPISEIPNEFHKAYNDLLKNPIPHRYGPAGGISDFKKALQEYRHVNVPEENIIVTDGAKVALYLALKATIKPGDEVIVFAPCWSSYIELVNMVGGIPILFYKMAMEVDRVITNKTKAILINNPNNPTGTVYNCGEMNYIIKLCELNNIWLISDEIYKDIHSDGVIIPTIGASKYTNCISIDGFSKSYAVTGWRSGYAYSRNTELIQAMTAYQSQMSGPPNTLTQMIIMNGLSNMTEDYFVDINEQYEEKKNIVSSILRLQDKPKGGFYYFLKTPYDGNVFCQNLLKQCNVALTPGVGYGVRNAARLSFASVTNKNLEKACTLIADYF